MVLTNAERQARFKERHKEDEKGLKKKERDRKRQSEARKKWKEELQRKPQHIQKREILEKQRKEREWKQGQRLAKKVETIDNLQSTPINGFRCRQTFGKAVCKARRVLPQSPTKRKAVVTQLSTEIGILPMKRRRIDKGPTSIDEATCGKVIAFYENDRVSRAAPGKKDSRLVCINGAKERRQLRHLVMSVQEAYQLYKRENPDDSIGKSTFFDLRPPYVRLVKDMPHDVCVCRIHAAMDDLCNGLRKVIPSFPGTGREMIEKFRCSREIEKCMFGLCDTCAPALQKLVEEMDVEIPTVTVMKWDTVDGHLAHVTVELAVEDALNNVVDSFQAYSTHCFIKDAQQQYFESRRSSVGAEEAVDQVDFAENFALVQQDEIQSAHWRHGQVTIFTVAVWLPGAKAKQMAIVTNDLTHDKGAVVAFLQIIAERLRELGVARMEIHSDGAGGQFKNRFILSLIPVAIDIIGMRIDAWAFSATSHGKGLVDVIGGRLKSVVWQEIRSRRAVVTTAEEFFNVGKSLLPGIDVLYVESNVLRNRAQIAVDRWTTTPPQTIVGTHKLHHFKPADGSDNIGTAVYSLSPVSKIFKFVKDECQ